MQFTRHTAGQGANLSVIVIILGMNLAITIDDLLSLLVLVCRFFLLDSVNARFPQLAFSL